MDHSIDCGHDILEVPGNGTFFPGQGNRDEKTVYGCTGMRGTGKEPIRTKETKLRFKINNHTISMDAVIMEYGVSWTGKGETSPVTLKVVGPVPKFRE